MKLARRTLAIGRKQLYALKDEHGQITFNGGEVMKVAEEFYRKLYSSSNRQTEDPIMNIEVPCVNMIEIKKAQKAIRKLLFD